MKRILYYRVSHIVSSKDLFISLARYILFYQVIMKFMTHNEIHDTPQQIDSAIILSLIYSASILKRS
jgi:hypothetical protein